MLVNSGGMIGRNPIQLNNESFYKATRKNKDTMVTSDIRTSVNSEEMRLLEEQQNNARFVSGNGPNRFLSDQWTITVCNQIINLYMAGPGMVITEQLFNLAAIFLICQDPCQSRFV